VVGVVGNDEAGELLAESLAPLGLANTHLVVEQGRTTTRKTRVLADSAHQVLRIDCEDDSEVSKPTSTELCSHALRLLKEVDVLVLSDYLKGALTDDAVVELIQQAKMLGKPVVANPKPRSIESYKGANLVSLNRKEAAEALGLWQGLADGNAEIAASNLCDRLDASILVTLGESGMVAASGKRICRVGAPKVEVYDTAGAGDTTIATVALGMATFGFEKTIFELAAQTSASVVRRIGVAVPTEEDLAAIRSL
jgi:D-beta-D-heptose 7-phosphate kinase/D-beta-D-heptose 1-phosphate adenosyltransferase